MIVKKAVFTLNVIDNYGEKTTFNIIEPMSTTLGRIKERLDDVMKCFELTGNVTLQFVAEDDGFEAPQRDKD